MQQYENLRAVAGAHNGLIGYGVIPVNDAGKSLNDFACGKGNSPSTTTFARLYHTKFPPLDRALGIA